MPTMSAAAAFLPAPALPPRTPHTRRPRTPQACASVARPAYQRSRAAPSAPPLLYTRRTLISTLGATLALSLSAKFERLLAAEVDAPAALALMRARADTVDALIDAARWDAVRTVLATGPLAGARAMCARVLAAAPDDAHGAVVGLREDLLSALRLLDAAVYSNVFVSEDRQVLGTRVDYDVPRLYLADVKEALDGLIDIAGG